MNHSNLEELLKSALEECERLRAEYAHLRMLSGIPNWTSAESSPTTIPIEVGSESDAEPPALEKKTALFRSLFRGCEDVYAVRWEGKNGKSGYSPPVPWTGAQSPPQGRRIVSKVAREDANAPTARG